MFGDEAGPPLRNRQKAPLCSKISKGRFFFNSLSTQTQSPRFPLLRTESYTLTPWTLPGPEEAEMKGSRVCLWDAQPTGRDGAKQECAAFWRKVSN